MKKELRDYQKKVIENILSNSLDLIVCLPTGAGKTVIANALMENLDGLKIFVVPRLELIKQANDEFGDVDIIWANKTRLTGKDVIISSKDSLRTQLDKIPKKEPITLIFDEVHIGIEQTYNLVSKIKHDRVIGFTATPERMDGLALTKGVGRLHRFGVFDDVLISETVPTLIQKGYLSQLKYYTKPINDITSIKSTNGSKEELSGEQMMSIFDKNQIWGDLVKCYEQYNPEKKPSIGFTTTINMAESVCELFNKSGYDFRVISGEMNVSTRNELIEMLRKGKINGLVNAALLTYGFDCPEVYYAFSCRHIKSRPLWFQMIGRILRVHEGKTEAIFVDHGDSISEFAEPSCSLPIMNPLIKWQYNGVPKEEKKEQKKQRDKANSIIKMINDLDPQPVDMVEVTSEDLFTRFVNIYNNVTKKIGSLKNIIKKERTEKEQLMIENKRLKLKHNVTKTIDSEKTFNYIRMNYCRKRKYYEQHHSNTDKTPHELTVMSFKNDEENLPFFYDKQTFLKSMSYWNNRINKEGFKY